MNPTPPVIIAGALRVVDVDDDDDDGGVLCGVEVVTCTVTAAPADAAVASGEGAAELLAVVFAEERGGRLGESPPLTKVEWVPPRLRITVLVTGRGAEGGASGGG